MHKTARGGMERLGRNGTERDGTGQRTRDREGWDGIEKNGTGQKGTEQDKEERNSTVKEGKRQRNGMG